MSPAPRHSLARAALFGCLVASVGCDTDFSAGWQEQVDELLDAGRRPEPPPPEEAGLPDAAMPAPGSDAAVPQMPLFDCIRRYRCDRSDPGCPPLCLVLSVLIDKCLPGEECRSEGYAPVRCEYCQPDPIK